MRQLAEGFILADEVAVVVSFSRSVQTAQRIARYRDRVCRGIERAVAEEHTPHEIAGSFGIGIVIAALPTAGTAFVLFAVIAYLSDRASKLGLFAALIVFNPPVKWGTYVASFYIGTRVLGPVPGLAPTDISTLSLTMGYDVLVRQLFGNLLLAAAAGILGYVIVRQLLMAYHRGALPTVIPR